MRADASFVGLSFPKHSAQVFSLLSYLLQFYAFQKVINYYIFLFDVLHFVNFIPFWLYIKCVKEIFIAIIFLLKYTLHNHFNGFYII